MFIHFSSGYILYIEYVRDNASNVGGYFERTGSWMYIIPLITPAY